MYDKVINNAIFNNMYFHKIIQIKWHVIMNVPRCWPQM